MNTQELLKAVEMETEKAKTDLRSAEGMAKIQEVAKAYNGEYRLVWSEEILEKIKNRPKKALHQTGLKKLDDLIGGFREQQLITLTAHTSHGKTAFSMFLTEIFEDLKPVVIPLEQSNEEIIEQRHDNGYHIPRFLSPESLATKVDVDWIEQRIIEGIAKYDTKLVLIDHLGYINDFGVGGQYQRENTAYRIGQVMKSLKNIAKRWNVIIVLSVHISQKDESKPPILEDIKNSSDIAQESDMVVMLWRRNEAKNKVRIYFDETMVSIHKNRRTGRNGNIGLRFDVKTGRYVEDDGWVESMEKSARESIEQDDNFAMI